MSVLQDESAKKEQSAATGVSSKERSKGYETPLFEDLPPKWSDDRIMGGGTEKMETRYHDRDMVLKVTNGLCYDIFFRAEDVFRPDFDEIPNFWDEPSESQSLDRSKKPELNKPLDSRHRQRTYLLDPNKPEEEKPKRKSSPKRSKRKPSRRRNRSRK